MYSREERMKAVELYIKYDKSAAAAIRELGYPDRHTLRSWYEFYLKEQETGIIRDGYTRASMTFPGFDGHRKSPENEGENRGGCFRWRKSGNANTMRNSRKKF